jgi:glycosyltransferase involved in cell wall biosynthesis
VITAARKPEALAQNDLAARAAAAGDLATARQGFQLALELDAACEAARANLALLDMDDPPGVPVKIGLVSFLFNWPSTGGGIVHTVELAQFLARAGYDVRHFYARYDPWQVGRVAGPLPFPSEGLDFDAAGWNVPAIQERFRKAVEGFAPDYVLLTDSWNMKPLLAEAVRQHPYLLRFQAMECICPLNNVRLLPGNDRPVQCRLNQLADSEACAVCVSQHGKFSGVLHRAERALAGVGTRPYHEKLLRALGEAEAVLVVNPLSAALVAPFARQVRVVTAGMDPVRFPYPGPPRPNKPGTVKTLLFAGLVQEPMKGFGVLQEACGRLWQKRQDFEVVATADPPGQVNLFTRFVGWQSQETLPRQIWAADVLVLPTVAQEALGRTAVEAMAAGRAVVASCLGGLPFTVRDGVTGLLCRPGDPADLAEKIETLLDDPDLREQMGRAGRQRFEEEYAWDVIIEKHYRPLLVRREKS